MSPINVNGAIITEEIVKTLVYLQTGNMPGSKLSYNNEGLESYQKEIVNLQELIYTLGEGIDPSDCKLFSHLLSLRALSELIKSFSFTNNLSGK